MNAYQLFTADGTPTLAWVCGECHYITGKSRTNVDGRAAAEACCRQIPCPDCGGELPRGYGVCSDCWRKHQEVQLAQRLASAEKLASWDSWVYWEGAGPQDGYFSSLEALLEWAEDEEAKLPEFVFVCETVPFRGLNVGDLIETCTEDSFEDAADHLVGVLELRAAVEAFNAANVGLVSYTPDWKRVVRVPHPTAEGGAA